MAGPLKILSVIGTRPETIKMFPLLHAFAKDARFLSRICVTGQHRAMVDRILQIAGIVPHHDLDLMRPDQTLDALTASLLVEIGKILDIEQPDRVVVQGDTATAMAGALAAYHRKIPVAHVEAGLRSGNIHHPWPEEVNRKIISALATFHFAPTHRAANALTNEAVDPGRVFVTGNTVIDALAWVAQASRQNRQLVGGLAKLEQRFAGKRIIAVTTHRRENIGDAMRNIAKAVRMVAQRPDVAVVFPVHPNPDIRPIIDAELDGLANVALVEPLDYPHFARLLDICTFILTDSGGIQEEAPALGKPVLIMRETTERPEGVEAGTARLVGTIAVDIAKECSRLLDDDVAYARMARAHNPFGDGKAAARIVEILAASGSGPSRDRC